MLILRTGNRLLGDFRRPEPRVRPADISGSDPFSNLSAQEAAVAMMVAIAHGVRGLSRPVQEAIFSIMDQTFDSRGEQAQNEFEAAIRLQAKADDPAHLVNCLSPVINKNCTTSEKKQLYSMLYLVATADKDEPDTEQTEILELLAEYLDIGRQFINTPQA
ncbi:MAG: hypothetical protein ACRBBN_08590 [Methyloligellaceae bacterium]